MESHPRLKIGVLGCGRVFERYHLPALRHSPDWWLAAACDTDKGRLDWVANQAPGAVRFESPTKLLERDDLDAVLISTTPTTHAELAITAMESGKHVLVEKPMAVSLSEADEMLRTSRTTDRRLAVGFNRRFRRSYLAARDRLQTIANTELRSVYHEFIVDARQWSRPASGSAPGDRLDLLLYDVASHQVDLVSWLLGQEIEAVRTTGSQSDASRTIVNFEMRLPSGLIASCRAGHCHRYQERFEARLPVGGFMVFPAGPVTFRGRPGAWTRMRGRVRSFEELIVSRLRQAPNMTLESFERQLSAFAALVRGIESPTDAADGPIGRRAVVAVQACRLSLEDEGSWQSIEVDHRKEPI